MKFFDATREVKEKRLVIPNHLLYDNLLRHTFLFPQVRPLWHREEQETALCREREGWRADLC